MLVPNLNKKGCALGHPVSSQSQKLLRLLTTIFLLICFAFQAVDRLDREGNLNLQPSVAQATEEWVNDQVDDPDDVEEAAEEASAPAINEGSSEICEPSTSQSTVLNNCDKIKDTNLQSSDEISCSSQSKTETNGVQSDSLKSDNNEGGDDTADEELSSSDIQEMKENLLSASEDATQLLTEINRDEGDSSLNLNQ